MGVHGPPNGNLADSQFHVNTDSEFNGDLTKWRLTVLLRHRHPYFAQARRTTPGMIG